MLNPSPAELAAPSEHPVARRRPNRAEKAEATRTRLFDAAVACVGEFGYAGASVARITERAKVAQGTFYNYFESRQDLLDQLLPTISVELHDYVRSKVRNAPDCAVERERARMSAFFDFLEVKPQLFKMLSEGRVQAPTGFARHLRNATESFAKAVETERARGNLRLSDPGEIAVVTQMLLASREYLSEKFCLVDGGFVRAPRNVLDSYMKVAETMMFKRADEA